jgi:hypothetical protein
MLQLTQQFSLLFLARTGSSYLQTALNNHPDITCASEEYIVETVHKEKLDPNLDLHPTISFGYSGIKVPLTVMEKYDLNHGFWETNVWHRPIIVCTRNPLRSFISYMLVHENNKAWFKREYTKPVYIDIDEAKRFVYGVVRMIDPFINIKNQQILVVQYEDGIDTCYRQSLKFLGLKYKPPKSSFTRQTVRPLKELVINYRELAASDAFGSLLRCNTR